ncbi:Ldh family oxidoreductase [Haloferax sp. DFSO52]|uniref:Ldh family oxidoreductase n=1 Tax=Haloferax sp. DFSO52 TaxID=3388505 RepID=UPI003A882718
MVDVDRARAEAVATRAFEAAGVDHADARLTAEMLVDADARGKHSHGLIRLPRYIRGVDHGNVDPAGEMTVVRDRGATATLDGGSRLGPVVALEALAEATSRADDYGVGVVGVHNSNHLGMLGYYTDKARAEGYVAIGMTNTEPAMPPYGGAESILGTNPLAIGIPTDPPFNLDMSTSSISRGEVFKMSQQGGTLPEGVALDADGEPTTDPDAALDGVILPFGGTKGSGLAIAIEILAGGLVGAAMGDDVTGTYHTENECTKGDLFIVIDPAALGGDGFTERADAFVESLKSLSRASGVDEIRLPGEASAQRATAETITVDDELWEEIQTRAEVSQ